MSNVGYQKSKFAYTSVIDSSETHICCYLFVKGYSDRRGERRRRSIKRSDHVRHNVRKLHNASLDESCKKRRIVVMGGYGRRRPIRSVECFDVSNKTWKDLSSMSEARAHVTAVVCPMS